MAIEYWQPPEPQRILKTRLRLVELLDDLKLNGCLAQTRVRVIPIFLDIFVPPEIPSIARANTGDGPSLGVRAAAGLAPAPTGGGGGSIDPPATEPTPYPHLAVTLEFHEQTNDQNYADFTIPLADAMVQVSAITREDGALPVGLCFDQAFSANAYGVQLPWTQPIGIELVKLEGKDPILIVDLAKSIVGDTSATHATLWFQVHGSPRAGERYVCDIVDIAPPGGQRFGGTHLDPSMSGGIVGTGEPGRPQRPGAVSVDPRSGGLLSSDTPAAPGGSHVDPEEPAVESDLDLELSHLRQRVHIDPNRAMTGVVTFRNLRPGALYGYLFKLHMADGTERVLTQGRFRTFETDPKRMNIAFASCHKPSDENSLKRWKALAQRTDQDVLFLMGDQIYADDIEKMYTRIDNWPDRYIARYNQLFAYQPMRDAMRTRPTYMILDDHEIDDDWGVSGAKIEPEQIEPGINAYRIFQQAHNPGGYSAPNFDYHFRRGRAAFYVTDNRTGRGPSSDYPVLGQAQYQRMLSWAKSAEVADADLVFVVVPVPPGILPIGAIQEIARIAVLAAPIVGGVAGTLGGAILGGIGGFLLGGPAGAIAGATLLAQLGGVVGTAGGIATIAYYDYTENNILEPDIRDAWTFKDNHPDLVRLLDVLFDVANDVSNGKSGPKPRGVFVLAGDYHFGAVHRLISKRSASRHGRNPGMMQITSSPISTGALHNETMDEIIDRTASGTFKLDDKYYVSKYMGRLMERNFGRVAFEHVGPGRRYHIQIFVEGETDTLAHLFELDLDKNPVVMRDMVGDVLAARGRISLLRVHDPNTGYGPSGDRIDGEVVIHLDTAPGRAFGFKLRKDAKLAANKAMLDLLRDAFNHGRMVAIDYKRTGLANGTIIRASLTPG